MLNPAHPLSRGLVGYWLFNEGAGSRANDISGYGNHGTLKNMLPNVQGSGWGGSKFGGGLQVDGVNDYVDCGNGDSLNITDAISVEAWVKVLSNGYVTRGGIFSRLATSSPWNGYVFDYSLGNDGKLSFFNAGSGWMYSDGNISDGQWHHCVVAGSGTSGAFYIDGQQSGTFTFGNAGSYLGDAFIGKNYDDYYFDGSIDSVRIYNRALAAAEVQQLYHDPFCNLLRVPIRYVAAAGPAGAIMNQFQKFNIGADLYNGGIIA